MIPKMLHSKEFGIRTVALRLTGGHPANSHFILVRIKAQVVIFSIKEPLEHIFTRVIVTWPCFD